MMKERRPELPGKMRIGSFEEKMSQIKWLDKYCNVCGKQLNSWDARVSKTLAYKNPCCESCIAKEYDMDVEVLRGKMEHFFDMRPCQGI